MLSWGQRQDHTLTLQFADLHINFEQRHNPLILQREVLNHMESFLFPITFLNSFKSLFLQTPCWLHLFEGGLWSHVMHKEPTSQGRVEIQHSLCWEAKAQLLWFQQRASCPEEYHAVTTSETPFKSIFQSLTVLSQPAGMNQTSQQAPGGTKGEVPQVVWVQVSLCLYHLQKKCLALMSSLQLFWLFP